MVVNRQGQDCHCKERWEDVEAGGGAQSRQRAGRIWLPACLGRSASLFLVTHRHRCHCSCFHHGTGRFSKSPLPSVSQGGMWGRDGAGRRARSSLGLELASAWLITHTTHSRQAPRHCLSILYSNGPAPSKITARITITSAISRVTIYCHSNYFLW